MRVPELNYTGTGDSTYTIEIVDDTSNPNTYRFKKDENGTWSDPVACNSTFHPDDGVGGEGFQIAFAEVVGHTSVRGAVRLYAHGRSLTRTLWCGVSAGRAVDDSSVGRYVSSGFAAVPGLNQGACHVL